MREKRNYRLPPNENYHFDLVFMAIYHYERLSSEDLESAFLEMMKKEELTEAIDAVLSLGFATRTKHLFEDQYVIRLHEDGKYSWETYRPDLTHSLEEDFKPIKEKIEALRK